MDGRSASGAALGNNIILNGHMLGCNYLKHKREHMPSEGIHTSTGQEIHVVGIA